MATVNCDISWYQYNMHLLLACIVISYFWFVCNKLTGKSFHNESKTIMKSNVIIFKDFSDLKTWVRYFAHPTKIVKLCFRSMNTFWTKKYLSSLCTLHLLQNKSTCKIKLMHTCTVLLAVMKKLRINWNWNAMFSFKSKFFFVSFLAKYLESFSHNDLCKKWAI